MFPTIVGAWVLDGGGAGRRRFCYPKRTEPRRCTGGGVLGGLVRGCPRQGWDGGWAREEMEMEMEMGDRNRDGDSRQSVTRCLQKPDSGCVATEFEYGGADSWQLLAVDFKSVVGRLGAGCCGCGRQEKVKVELGIRGLGGGRVDGGSWSSAEVGLGPVALDQGGQAAGLRGSHVLFWYRQWDTELRKGHWKKAEAERRRCCLSFCELQPWDVGG